MLAAVASAVLGWRYRTAQRQREILAELNQFGLHATYDGGYVMSLEFLRGDKCLTDHELALINELGTLRTLDLTHTCVSDDGVGQLLELHRLKYLVVNEKSITGEGVRGIVRASPNVTVLFVRTMQDNTRVIVKVY